MEIEIKPIETPEEPKEELPSIIIPECCREGWESCPHVAKPIKKTKTNIGL